MTSMTMPAPGVTGGVDTHGHTHHAAVIDPLGRPLGDREFSADPAGYRALRDWLCSFGPVDKVGIEGTGSYGAGLTQVLRHNAVIVEVDRPNRRARRRQGKSDPLDAYAAARAAANGDACGHPKTRDGNVERIRIVRLVRSSAVKARTQAMNQLKAVLVTCPPALREQLRALSPAALISTCARLRPSATAPALEQTTKLVLRRLATRHRSLTVEIKQADVEVTALITSTAPHLLDLLGVGPDVAGQLLTTMGDNPTRMRSEAAFAHLCGVAPLPASTARSDRHRLNRSGDRQANRALHVITLTRMRYDERTREYVTRRTAQGLSTKDITRCLKRYIARELYRALTNPSTPLHST